MKLGGRFNIHGLDIVGRNVTITNDQIIVDGKVVSDGVSGIVEVRVLEGKIDNLESHSSVSCLDVGGSVKAGSSVSCGDVGGDVKAGSSISCRDVSGDAKAGSSLNARNLRDR